MKSKVLSAENEITRGLKEVAMDAVSVAVRKLNLNSIDLYSSAFEGKLIIRINEVLICNVSCEEIDTNNLIVWFGWLDYWDKKWSETNDRSRKQQIVDEMVSDFNKIVLQSA